MPTEELELHLPYHKLNRESYLVTLQYTVHVNLSITAECPVSIIHVVLFTQFGCSLHDLLLIFFNEIRKLTQVHPFPLWHDVHKDYFVDELLHWNCNKISITEIKKREFVKFISETN